MPSNQLNPPQKNGLALLLKTILGHWNCFLSTVATDCKDGNGWHEALTNHQKNYYG